MQNQNDPPSYTNQQPLSLVPISTQKANGPQIVLTPIRRNLVQSPLSISGVKPIQIVYPLPSQTHQTQMRIDQPIQINTRPPEKLILNKEKIILENENKPKQNKSVAKNVKNEPLKQLRIIRDHEKETFKDGVWNIDFNEFKLVLLYLNYLFNLLDSFDQVI
jgi:hypothetical protein